MEPYYYTKMSKPKQAVYHAIYQGLMALSDSFQVPKLEGRELSDVIFPAALRSSGDILGRRLSLPVLPGLSEYYFSAGVYF